jgi:DNA-binding transcriptional LysR family regulator
VQSARLAAKGKVGVVRLGFVSTAGNQLLARLTREYRAVNPLVEFSLRNVLTADQGRMLEEGSLDLGFLRMPFVGGPAVEVIPIHREPFVMVVPSSHRLARKSAVRLRETANETYVLYVYERAHAPGFHDLVLGILNRARVIPEVFQVAGEMPTLICLIASGAGISLLPLSAVKVVERQWLGARSSIKSRSQKSPWSGARSRLHRWSRSSRNSFWQTRA